MQVRARLSKPMVAVLAASMLLFAGLFAGFGAQKAFAHDQLIAGDPPSGNAIAKAPEKITLTFSGEIRQVSGGEANQIIVQDRDGNELTYGDVTVKGTKVSRAMQPLPEGTYDVKWSALSSDGHRIQGDGNYSFTVTEGASKKDIEAWEKSQGGNSDDGEAGSGKGSEDGQGSKGSDAAAANTEDSASAQAKAVTPESTADTTTIMWIVGAAFLVLVVIGLILQVTLKKTGMHRH
ncbi:copper resistance CopC family protein [Pseudoglutamicibacter albus]|uniref:Methionine-rich copper-binding protein CopC n=1 Tax=Pseudoglutamicibacter albus TaxID=98671 RepID=A0ABU1Z121_9MICC|nr:copper resistance protein CopC [Pseudoglutamicibacter albus]MDR7294311.1 methionine-rich copper-binding protein CopC [Pseudoglutamicibacter albus]